MGLILGFITGLVMGTIFGAYVFYKAEIEKAKTGEPFEVLNGIYKMVKVEVKE